MKGHTNDSWKMLLMSYFSCLNKDFDIELLALRITDTSDQINKKNIPLLYKDCILYFQELYRKVKVFKNSTPEIIWCNHKLQFNGKPLAYKHWAKSGIKMINDIIGNSILKERDIYNNLVFKASLLFEMFTLKYCIPMNGWKKPLI